MYALYILAAILLLLLLLLFARVRVTLVYKENARAYARFLFLRFPIYPQNKKKVRISDFSYKNLKKRKKQKIPSDNSKQIKRTSQKDTKKGISSFYRILKALYPHLLRYFRIDATRIHITVGTGDAAQTAIAYGAVSQTVAYICAILDQHTNFHTRHKSSVVVVPDFTAENFSADCKISASLQLWQVLHLGLRFFAEFLKNKKQDIPTREI